MCQAWSAPNFQSKLGRLQIRWHRKVCRPSVTPCVIKYFGRIATLSVPVPDVSSRRTSRPVGSQPPPQPQSQPQPQQQQTQPQQQPQQPSQSQQSPIPPAPAPYVTQPYPYPPAHSAPWHDTSGIPPQATHLQHVIPQPTRHPNTLWPSPPPPQYPPLDASGTNATEYPDYTRYRPDQDWAPGGEYYPEHVCLCQGRFLHRYMSNT